MKKINKLTDKELQSEYKSLHYSIDMVDCFGSKDILRMELLEQELQQRGFQIISDINFKKEK